jgi:hypothetical protein
MSQRSRRQDPYPRTWEIPLILVDAILILGVFGIHIGRAIANVLAGSVWMFPNRVNLFSSLSAFCAETREPVLLICTGSPHRRVACIDATELILLAGTVFLIKLGLDRRGSGRMKGVASPGEAEKLLGVTRLRRSRKIIRPDLYRKRRHGFWR